MRKAPLSFESGAFLKRCLTMIRPALRAPGAGTLHGETPKTTKPQPQGWGF